jgi:mRNA degradation ribonuclease J1/J2
VVDYRGVDGELSRGTVWIETPLAHAERIKTSKKAAEKTD